MKKLENIYYTNMKLPQQILDVYLPDCDAFPVFIYFHGGGIESGDKTEPTFYNDLQQKGIATVNGYIEEMIEGQKVVKVFNHEEKVKHDFDIINVLTDKGYLFPSKYKNKSVTLTKEGEKLAEELINKYLK